MDNHNATSAPKPEALRIALDAAVWAEGYEDGVHGRPGNTHCLSYASGFIEGKARRQKQQEEKQDGTSASR